MPVTDFSAAFGIVQRTPDCNNRLRLLRKAYETEFAGNIKEVTREAAEAWARDYPETFEKYLSGY